MLNGLNRQAALTLLDLNQRISQGVMLSGLENTCLGAFNETLGEPLLAIDCGTRNIAIDGVDILVGKAAFFDTPACRAAIFAGNSSDCVLEELSLTINSRFVTPAAGRPSPVFPGSLIDYAIDGTDLVIRNLPDDALTGVFSCSIDLTSEPFIIGPADDLCNDTILLVADEIDFLNPE